MKKIPIALLFAGILLSASLSWAQGNAPAPAAPSIAAPSIAAPSAAGQQAPAAAPEPLPAWLEYKPSYTGEENDIANPHRTAEEMTTWAQQAAADVLSFSPDDYDAKMSSFKKYFVKQGWQLYAAYLKDSKIVERVGESGYSVGAIVTEVPEIVSQGASGGAYHWIMRMPITISFFKKDPASDDTKAGPSAKFYLFIDVMRVAQGGGDDGIAITNWRMMDVPKN